MNTYGSSFWSSGNSLLVEPQQLRSIVAVASDIALVVSSEGTVLSVLPNGHDDAYGNLHNWEGRHLTAFLTSESIQKFNDAYAAFLSGSGSSRLLELNHTDNATWEFPMRYTFHRIGDDDTVVMLGRDLRPIAEAQQQLVRAQMALEQGYEARRERDAHYRALLSRTRDPMVFIGVEDGRVIDMNAAASQLFGGDADAFKGGEFADFFEHTDTGELIEQLIAVSAAEGSGASEVELRNKRCPVKISPALFRAAGNRVLLCRLEEPSDGDTHDDVLSGLMVQLFDKGHDAILFTDAQGQITLANDGFLDLVDAGTFDDIRGRNFSDFLNRGQVDLNMLLRNARGGRQVRFYSTKLNNDYGSKLSVEITGIVLSGTSQFTFGFVVRDVGRVKAVRPASTSNDDASQNVTEMVGSTSLKEILAETTDVVEKMCIETAVNLTRNNRVATAEMLGLSRQSLYVKLRKYGLLRKNKNRDGTEIWVASRPLLSLATTRSVSNS
ncbi:MAG: transcriptional regulator PpsR [Rhodobacteraceae bacterium]|nr:transcriptional regulator PpsR [Paracoccaceae bacterium]